MKLCKFLGKQLDDAQIDSVVKHSSFSSMKENKMSNWTQLTSDILDHTKGSFLRKGMWVEFQVIFTYLQRKYKEPEA